jgi:hypothetical protein
MTFLSSSKELPIWNPQCGGLKEFLVMSIKTPQVLCSCISQENSINIGLGHFPFRNISPIMGRAFPYEDQNIRHREKWVVIPGFCVPDFNKPHKGTNWLARASKGPH